MPRPIGSRRPSARSSGRSPRTTTSRGWSSSGCSRGTSWIGWIPSLAGTSSMWVRAGVRWCSRFSERSAPMDGSRPWTWPSRWSARSRPTWRPTASPRSTLGVGDIDTLDLGEVSADAVTASMVLFFVPEPGRALRRCTRVLRPGGRLAFSVFGGSDPRWRAVYDAFLPFLPRGGERRRPQPTPAPRPVLRRAVAGGGGVRGLRGRADAGRRSTRSTSRPWTSGMPGAGRSACAGPGCRFPRTSAPPRWTPSSPPWRRPGAADGRLTEEFSVHSSWPTARSTGRAPADASDRSGSVLLVRAPVEVVHGVVDARAPGRRGSRASRSARSP